MSKKLLITVFAGCLMLGNKTTWAMLPENTEKKDVTTPQEITPQEKPAQPIQPAQTEPTPVINPEISPSTGPNTGSDSNAGQEESPQDVITPATNPAVEQGECPSATCVPDKKSFNMFDDADDDDDTDSTPEDSEPVEVSAF